MRAQARDLDAFSELTAARTDRLYDAVRLILRHDERAADAPILWRSFEQVFGNDAISRSQRRAPLRDPAGLGRHRLVQPGGADTPTAARIDRDSMALGGISMSVQRGP